MLQAFSKVIIYANYYINKEYIAKVLCINKDKPEIHCEGKCQLKKELDKEEKKEQSPANPLNEKNEIQLFSQNNSNIFLFIPFSTNHLTAYYSFHLSEEHFHSIFHPPKNPV